MTRTVNDIFAEAREARVTAQARMLELRDRILRGESTGDPIRDFMIVYGWQEVLEGASTAIEESYRGLARRLAGKTGQFVLMIERDADRPGRCASPMTLLREGFTFGCLVDDKLRFELRDDLPPDAPLWTFPTERYAKRGDFRFVDGDGAPISLESGGVHPWLESTFFRRLEELVDFGHQHEGLARFSLGVQASGPIPQLSLFIGNDEISAWCRGVHANSDPPETDIRRVDMIRHLARTIGSDLEGIPAIKQAIAAR